MNKTNSKLSFLKKNPLYMLLCIGLACLIGFAGLTFIVLKINDQMHAAITTTISKDLPDGAPKQDISVPDLTQFYKKKPSISAGTFSRSSSNFVIVDGGPFSGSKWSVKYNGTASAGNTPNGQWFSLRWNDIAVDSSGNKIDIVLKVSNFRGYSVKNPYYITARDDGSIYTTSAGTADRTRAWFDCEYFFYKSGTDTPSTGTTVFQFVDLDIYTTIDGTVWDETIGLTNNYVSPVHILKSDKVMPNCMWPDYPGCWLKISENNTRFSVKEGGWTDNDTLHSGFAVQVKNGFKFYWWGADGCGTGINNFYPAHKIVASNGAGGSVKPSGTTYVPWKNDKTYTIAANANYKIKSLTVDGVSKTVSNSKSMTYKFTGVVADHKIDAQFENIKVNLSYNKNLSTATGTTNGLTNVNAGSQQTVASNGFSDSKGKYKFKNWNTKADGTGTTYTPSSKITMGESSTTLYAIWEAKSYTIRYFPNGSNVTGSMANQKINCGTQATLNANAFSREDYDWVGWNTKADNTGTSYGNKASFTITPADGSNYDLYAIWKPHTNSKLSIEKRANKEQATVGDKITYYVTVSNIGNVTLKDVTVSDAPLGISSMSVASLLKPGEKKQVEFSYTVTEQDALAHSIKNVATAAAKPNLSGFPTPAPAKSNEVTVGVVTNPSLVVEKTTSMPKLENPHAGDVVSFDVTLKNTGNITLTDISAQDTLSNGKELDLAFDATEIAPKASVTAHVTYELTQQDIDTGELINTASAKAKDPTNNVEVVGLPDSATIELQRNPSMTLSKITAETTYAIGDELTYIFTVKNTGNVTLSNVTVTDSNLDLVDMGLVGVLAPNDETTIEVAAPKTTQFDAKDGIDNKALAEADTPDGAPTLDTVEDSWHVDVSSSPSISIEKTTMQEQITTPSVGDTISYLITVKNTGNINLYDLVIDDTLSNGKKLDLGDYDKTLEVDQTLEINASYVLTQEDIDAEQLSNVAKAVAKPIDEGEVVEDKTEPVTTVFENDPKISLSLEPDRELAHINDIVKHTATIENTGNTTLRNIIVSCPLTNDTITLDGVILKPGETKTIELVYDKVTQEDAINGCITCTADAVGESIAGNKAQDEASVTTNVESKPAIEMIVSADREHIDSAKPGDTLTYTYHVTNVGDIFLEEIETPSNMDDEKPLDTPKTEKIQANGGDVIYTVEYVITQDDIDRGEITNTAHVVAHDPSRADEVIGNETSVITKIDRHPSVSISKSANKDEVGINGTIDYSIVVENTGDVTLESLNVEDELIGVSKQFDEVLRPGKTFEVEGLYEKVTQEDAVFGSIVNVAYVDGVAPDGSSVSSSTTAKTTVKSSPSIFLVSSVDRRVIENPKVGDVLAYDYTVDNTGNIYLNDIILPSFVSDGRILPLQVPTTPLQVKDQFFLNNEYEITQADIDRGYVENTTIAYAENPAADGASVIGNKTVIRTELYQHPSVEVRKIADRSVANIGDEIKYEIIVTNTGNTTLRDIRVTDDLTGDNGILAAETLLPGDNKSVFVTYDLVTEANAIEGKVTNVANVEATAPKGSSDIQKVDNSTEEVTRTHAQPSLSITKTSDVQEIEKAKPGDVIIWKFEVENTGDVTIENIAIQDEMLDAAGYDLTSALASTTLAPSQKTHGEIAYEITQDDVDAGKVTNTAFVTGTSKADGNDSVESQSSTQEVKLEQLPGLDLTKEVSHDIAEINDELTYTMTVYNSGNTSLTDVYLSDIVLGDVLVSTKMAPKQSEVIQASIVVSEDDAVAKLIESPATATALPPASMLQYEDDEDNNDVLDGNDNGEMNQPGEGEQQGGAIGDDNNTSIAKPKPSAQGLVVKSYVETKVVSRPSFSVEKSAEIIKVGNIFDAISGDSPVMAGDEVLWNIHIENTGNITLTNLVVDDLPAYARGAEIVCDNTFALAPGEDYDIELRGKLTQDDIDAGYMNNIVIVSLDSIDGTDVERQTDEAKVEYERFGKMKVTKDADSKYMIGAIAGNKLIYTVTLENEGNTTLSDIKVIDELEGAKIINEQWGIKDIVEDETQSDLNTSEDALDDIANNDVKDDIESNNGDTSIDAGVSAEPNIDGNDEDGNDVDLGSAPLINNPLTVTNGNVLLPGEKAIITLEYEITQADIDAGVVVNSAYATYDEPTGGPQETTDGALINSMKRSESEKATVSSTLVSPEETDLADELIALINNDLPLDNILQTGDERIKIFVLVASGMLVLGVAIVGIVRRKLN